MAFYNFDRRIINPSIKPWGHSRVFTPADITTALWLDASDGDTFTITGSGVSAWNDKSGNDSHSCQDNDSYRPVRVSDSVVFDGVNDFMDLTNTADRICRNVGGFSVFHVTDVNTANTVNILRISASSAAGNVRNASGVKGIGIRRQESDPYLFFSYDLAAPSGKTITSCITSYVGGSVHAARNGDYKFITSSFNGGGNTSNSSSAGVWVGGTGYNPTLLPYNGTIHEIIAIQNALPESDRQKIEGYLAHKWGLEDNLPNDHPYKTYAPRA